MPESRFQGRFFKKKRFPALKATNDSCSNRSKSRAIFSKMQGTPVHYFDDSLLPSPMSATDNLFSVENVGAPTDS